MKYIPVTVANIGGNPTAAGNTINDNLTAISTAIEDTLSRDGTVPNQMAAQLDMNTNEILNVGPPSAGASAARWMDLTGSITLTGMPIPSLVGATGKFLTNDGTNLGWGNAPTPTKAAIGLGNVDNTSDVNKPVSTATTAAIAASRKLLQRVYNENTTNSAMTTTTPLDDTVPTTSEGSLILTATITPASASNILRIRTSCFAGASIATTIIVSVFQGATCIGVQAQTVASAALAAFSQVVEVAAGSTSLQTITVRIGPAAAGTVRINGSNSARLFGGTSRATLIIDEIVP